jgi:hypothetical protein
LPYKALQVGDLRCNRVTYGLWAGDRYVPLLDDTDPRDLRARDVFLSRLPGNLLFAPPLLAGGACRQGDADEPGLPLPSHLVVDEAFGEAAQSLHGVAVRLVTEPAHCRLDVAKGPGGKTPPAARIQVARHAASIVFAKLPVQVCLQQGVDAHAFNAVAHPLQKCGHFHRSELPPTPVETLRVAATFRRAAAGKQPSRYSGFERIG